MDCPQNDMGVASSRNKPVVNTTPLKGMSSKIKILHLQAKIDNEPTKIDETSPAVLKYRTPNFRWVELTEINKLRTQNTYYNFQ